MFKIIQFTLLILLFIPNLVLAELKYEISAVANAANNKVPWAIIREAYSRIGIDVTLIGLPGNVALVKVNEGEFDAELFRIAGIAKKYPNLIQVPVAIDADKIVFITKPNFPSLNDWQDISKLYIGIKKGVIFSEKNTMDMNTFSHYDVEQLMHSLINDRIDVIVTTESNLQNFKNEKDLGQIKIHYPDLSPITFYHYIHKKNEFLLFSLTQALEDMQRLNEFEMIKSGVLD